MEIIDISLEIKQDMIIYPNNPIPSITPFATIPDNRTNESIISIGSHTGTHVDAPLHIDNKGQTSNDLPLTSFYGDCRVLDLIHAGEEIHKEHLVSYNIKAGEIILLKTENSLNQYETFRTNFAHIKLDAAEYLVAKKIKTLGIDYLSVKKFGADHNVHRILIQNLTLFEGLYLTDVKSGKYVFIGFPLKLQSDGAPARAILLKK